MGYPVSSIVSDVGQWRAAVLLDEIVGAFEPTAWHAEDDVARLAQGKPRAATVEVRRSGGGIRPLALLAGAYNPDGDAHHLRLLVLTNGPLTMSPPRDCDSPLGGRLSTGLPEEFGQAALSGLVRFRPELNRPGSLTVRGSAYDAVDSSEFAFEHAAALLKWVLLEVQGSVEVSEAGLTTFLRSWSTL